jgi:hypothetical protein
MTIVPMEVSTHECNCEMSTVKPKYLNTMSEITGLNKLGNLLQNNTSLNSETANGTRKKSIFSYTVANPE